MSICGGRGQVAWMDGKGECSEGSGASWATRRTPRLSVSSRNGPRGEGDSVEGGSSSGAPFTRDCRTAHPPPSPLTTFCDWALNDEAGFVSYVLLRKFEILNDEAAISYVAPET